MIVLFYVLGFWVFASILPGLEHALLLKSVWYLWGLVPALLAARLGLRKLRDDDPISRVLIFDQVPDTAFELLNLSVNDWNIKFLETQDDVRALDTQGQLQICSPWRALQGVFMSKLRPLIALTLCLCLFSSTSQAWWASGHMAVAYVAYQKLTPEKRTRVAQLLKKNPYYKTKWKALIPKGTPTDQQDLMYFMIAATWPDQIKDKNSGYISDGTDGGNRPPAGPEASQNIGYSD